MTKKQAYKIIEEKFGDYKGGYIDWLCAYPTVGNKEMVKDWRKYWALINKESRACFISDTFYRSREPSLRDIRALSGLARLMFLNHFIEDTYK